MMFFVFVTAFDYYNNKKTQRNVVKLKMFDRF